jgi:hypothetical protein
MALIWCSLSAHGFGHAAQAIPVLNELGRRISGLRVILRTALPPSLFEARLQVPWELSAAAQDVGCVQRGPLVIDVQETWTAHRRFHADWEQKVEAEVQAIRLKAPALVLTSISHLAIEAGSRTRIPTIGLCNLSWDLVLEQYLVPGQSDQADTLQLIRQAYGQADLMIRPTPGLALPAFRKIEDVGPMVQPLSPGKPSLRAEIGADPSEKIVLVGFGGIALDSLPYDRLDQQTGYRFIVYGPVPAHCTRIHRAESLPLPFSGVLASADILVTKPGYCTVVEAVALGLPVVYVRRYNFADEDSLVGYLHRYGRAQELSREDFEAGQWEESLDKVLRLGVPAEAPPVPNGAGEAADILARYL